MKNLCKKMDRAFLFSRLKLYLASNGNLYNATKKRTLYDCTLSSFAVIAFTCKHLILLYRYLSKCLSLSLARFSENVQKLSKLFLHRPTSPLNTSIFWVEYVAKYGNVLQSPAINLYWWQRNLLDVYGFILAVIITALGVVLFVLRKLKNLLFGSRVCAKDSAAIKSKKNK